MNFMDFETKFGKVIIRPYSKKDKRQVLELFV